VGGVIGVANRKVGYTTEEQKAIRALVKEAEVLCEASRRREREKALERGYVIHEPSGETVRMAGAMMDLSEYNRLETERQQSDERFRLVVEGVKDYAIFRLD